MAHKQFILDANLPVTIYKRKSNRNLRLSLTPTGQVRVTIPTWAPYSAGLQFAKSRYDWIIAQRQEPGLLLDGQAIGKAHRLRLQAAPHAPKPSSRLAPGEVIVRYPVSMTVVSPEVQQVARTASIRALRAQAERLLPQRLASLAAIHGFTYRSVTIKQLKSRWGSCDQQQNIVLNLYLMQLSWEHIDYVLLHELTHTKILRHGPAFWAAMESVLPHSKSLRKALHQHQPILA